MKKFAAVLVLVAAALTFGACAHEGGMQQGMKEGGGMAMAQGSSKIYWCFNATDGVCSGISTTRGTCPDGKPMNAGHVVWVEGTTALVCPCGDTCTCKIDLAGTGIYFCNCKGSCGCSMISDKPGACKCGMPLKQAK